MGKKAEKCHQNGNRVIFPKNISVRSYWKVKLSGFH